MRRSHPETEELLFLVFRVVRARAPRGGEDARWHLKVTHEAARRDVGYLGIPLRSRPNGAMSGNGGNHTAIRATGAVQAGCWQACTLCEYRVYLHPQTPVFARLYSVQVEVVEVHKNLETKILSVFLGWCTELACLH